MIRVLYISHEADEVLGSTLSLANHLHALRQDVEPLVVVPREGSSARHLRNLGYEVLAIRFKLNVTPKRLSWLKRLPRQFWDGWINEQACRQLSIIVRERNIQIIHTNSSVTLLGHQLKNYLCHHYDFLVPHVWHLREFQDLDFGFQPFNGWNSLRHMVSDSDAIIAITRTILDHYVDNHPRSFVVNDAVRRRDDISTADKQPYLLFCGRVIPNKGAETALHIFAAIAPHYPELSLRYVGSIEPEYQQQLSALAQQRGIADRIFFEGFQSDIRLYMQHATALLMCSRNEAQGRVTVEAMFYGTPVIAMASGGTLEIVEDGVNGLLFNNIQEGAAQLIRLVDDPELAQHLINEAHDTASERFSEEGYRFQMLHIYHSVL